MKPFIIFLALITPLMGCEENNQTPKQIPFIEIGKGHLPSNSIFSRETILIESQERWVGLIEDMNSIYPKIDDSFTENKIDFEQFICIAVFDKQNSTTSVDVTQIIERENNITVIIENIDKGISQDISHPFHIVKMTKTNKPITFIKE